MAMIDLTIPKDDRYFEDYAEGDTYEVAEQVEMTEPSIIRFAKEFDPQYFHTDPEAAKNSIYKGLIASGVQTMLVSFRLNVQYFLPGKASLGSPGISELYWLKPVRSGDVLRVRGIILSSKPSRSKNDRGIITSSVETVNQKDEVVMSYKAVNIMRKRNPGYPLIQTSIEDLN